MGTFSEGSSLGQTPLNNLHLFFGGWGAGRLAWVFAVEPRLSLVAAWWGLLCLWCEVFPLWWLLLLQGPGSVGVAHELSCPAARGIFLDQGPNSCPLHWQADS